MRTRMKRVISLGLLAFLVATAGGREGSAAGNQQRPQVRATDPTLRSRDHPEMERLRANTTALLLGFQTGW